MRRKCDKTNCHSVPRWHVVFQYRTTGRVSVKSLCSHHRTLFQREWTYYYEEFTSRKKAELHLLELSL